MRYLMYLYKNNWVLNSSRDVILFSSKRGMSRVFRGISRGILKGISRGKTEENSCHEMGRIFSNPRDFFCIPHSVLPCLAELVPLFGVAFLSEPVLLWAVAFAELETRLVSHSELFGFSDLLA